MLNDGCTTTSADMLGSANFNTLAVITAGGKQINFASGATQTVAGNLTLSGQAGNLLAIRSTAPGSPAFL
jgi:hypothetical protein